MLSLGPVSFLAPLTLLGLLLLPLIWWILRVTPPAPKQETFPPLRILQDVMSEEETPNSTPLWLLLFRLLLVSLIAIALARPVMQAAKGTTDRPLIIALDSGWDAAPNWSTMLKEAENRISDARRKNLNVLLVTGQDDDAPTFAPANDAIKTLKALRPTPLPSNRDAMSNVLEQTPLDGTNAIWLSSGVEFGNSEGLANVLKMSASSELVRPNGESLPLLPGDISESAEGFRMVWHRPDNRAALKHTIIAQGRDGTMIGRAPVTFSPTDSKAEALFELPGELRNRIATLRVESLSSAGSVHLLDDSWGRPLVGILTPQTDDGSPLLSEPFYARTALAPYADVFTGTLDTLLPMNPSILVMPDVTRTEAEALTEFVENGGLLIRFAGPKLAARPDALVPVDIREGGRDMGGALTWQEPQRLAPFSTDSPFFGLDIPEDVTVSRQIMAEPGAETDSKAWARLEDGSPIVTSAQYGLGRVVLFHVTAGPDWSNLSVSGLYVDMLRRLLSRARQTQAANTPTTGDWAPDRVLNGFGQLGSPGIEARPVASADFTNTTISQAHPPGLYRQGGRRQALNTVSNPEAITRLPTVSGMTQSSYGQSENRTLGGWLLGLALLGLCLDAFFALLVSGRLGNLRSGRKSTGLIAGLALAALFINPIDVTAQSMPEDALDLHLAYVKTGDARQDQMSEAAMRGVVDALNRRTTIEPVGVRGVDPETDILVYYPFLYYPVSRNTGELSDKAAEALNDFMAAGGTLVLDTQDAGDQSLLGGAPHPGLSKLAEKLDIPAVEQVPEDHVLTKSFYLLQVFPGRWANGPVWVERDNNGAARDGVSSVIIGSNDWAAGWAMDENNEPLITLERDIPKQREMSLRFGVNIAMYALAGNYKGDQVHAAALVERLGQKKREPRNLGTSVDTEESEK